MAPTTTTTTDPTPLPVKSKPQPPRLNLLPFQHKDPNVIIARLERERTVLEDRLADSAETIAALERHVAELHAHYDPQPDPEPTTEPAPAGA